MSSPSKKSHGAERERELRRSLFRGTYPPKIEDIRQTQTDQRRRFEQFKSEEWKKKRERSFLPADSSPSPKRDGRNRSSQEAQSVGAIASGVPEPRTMLIPDVLQLRKTPDPSPDADGDPSASNVAVNHATGVGSIQNVSVSIADLMVETAPENDGDRSFEAAKEVSGSNMKGASSVPSTDVNGSWISLHKVLEEALCDSPAAIKTSHRRFKPNSSTSEILSHVDSYATRANIRRTVMTTRDDQSPVAARSSSRQRRRPSVSSVSSPARAHNVNVASLQPPLISPDGRSVAAHIERCRKGRGGQGSSASLCSSSATSPLRSKSAPRERPYTERYINRGSPKSPKRRLSTDPDIVRLKRSISAGRQRPVGEVKTETSSTWLSPYVRSLRNAKREPDTQEKVPPVPIMADAVTMRRDRDDPQYLDSLVPLFESIANYIPRLLGTADEVCRSLAASKVSPDDAIYVTVSTLQNMQHLHEEIGADMEQSVDLLRKYLDDISKQCSHSGEDATVASGTGTLASTLVTSTSTDETGALRVVASLLRLLSEGPAALYRVLLQLQCVSTPSAFMTWLRVLYRVICAGCSTDVPPTPVATTESRSRYADDAKWIPGAPFLALAFEFVKESLQSYDDVVAAISPTSILACMIRVYVEESGVRDDTVKGLQVVGDELRFVMTNAIMDLDISPSRIYESFSVLQRSRSLSSDQRDSHIPITDEEAAAMKQVRDIIDARLECLFDYATELLTSLTHVELPEGLLWLGNRVTSHLQSLIPSSASRSIDPLRCVWHLRYLWYELFVAPLLTAPDQIEQLARVMWNLPVLEKLASVQRRNLRAIHHLVQLVLEYARFDSPDWDTTPPSPSPKRAQSSPSKQPRRLRLFIKRLVAKIPPIELVNLARISGGARLYGSLQRSILGVGQLLSERGTSAERFRGLFTRALTAVSPTMSSDIIPGGLALIPPHLQLSSPSDVELMRLAISAFKKLSANACLAYSDDWAMCALPTLDRLACALRYLHVVLDISKAHLLVGTSTDDLNALHSAAPSNFHTSIMSDETALLASFRAWLAERVGSYCPPQLPRDVLQDIETACESFHSSLTAVLGDPGYTARVLQAAVTVLSRTVASCCIAAEGEEAAQHSLAADVRPSRIRNQQSDICVRRQEMVVDGLCRLRIVITRVLKPLSNTPALPEHNVHVSITPRKNSLSSPVTASAAAADRLHVLSMDDTPVQDTPQDTADDTVQTTAAEIANSQEVVQQPKSNTPLRSSGRPGARGEERIWDGQSLIERGVIMFEGNTAAANLYPRDRVAAGRIVGKTVIPRQTYEVMISIPRKVGSAEADYKLLKPLHVSVVDMQRHLSTKQSMMKFQRIVFDVRKLLDMLMETSPKKLVRRRR